jgi:hypothetical protein
MNRQSNQKLEPIKQLFLLKAFLAFGAFASGPPGTCIFEVTLQSRSAKL